jgi:hypothetical protein
MAEAFADHGTAALALITTAPLTVKEGGFVGQMIFSDIMSSKQARWLDILLDRHALPSINQERAT